MNNTFINSEKNIIDSIEYIPEKVLGYVFKESWIGLNHQDRSFWDKFFGSNETRKYESGWWNSNSDARFLCKTNSQAEMDKFGYGYLVKDNQLIDRAKIIINTKNVDTNTFNSYVERFDSDFEANTRIDVLKNFAHVKFLAIKNSNNQIRYNGFY